MKDIDPLRDLYMLIRGKEPYEDRLRATNMREFTVDHTLVKKDKEFVRDTTLDPK